MPNIFDLYKPLRNQVRNFELIESLKICWHLSNYLDKESELPPNIELDVKLKNNFNPYLFRVNLISEWELEFLVSELVLNAPVKVFNKKQSLNSLKFRNSAVSHIRRMRDASYLNLNDEQNIFLEMNRISHQQFIWQTNYNYTVVYRYYKIFNDNTLNGIVLRKLDLSVQEILAAGLILVLYFSTNFSLDIPILAPKLSQSEQLLNKFVEKYSITIDSLKDGISETRKYDDTLLYGFNPIRKYPLFNINNSIYCPIPKLLYWQITSGIYYNICSHASFDNAFGFAFQNYLMELIQKVNLNDKLIIHPEHSYGNPEKRTADIIIEDDDSLLFIECKTKRMVWRAKELLTDTLDSEIDIEIISSAIYQLYKTVQDYQNNLYPQINYNSEKKIYVMVITLEDWYIGYNNFLYGKLLENIVSSFISDNRKATPVLNIPYFLFSSDEFERSIQVIESIGIKNYCEGFLNKSGFDAFKSFEYKSLFEAEVKNLFFNNQ